MDLTEEQITEAFTYFFEEYGPSVQLWSEDRKNKAVEEYWADRQQSDDSIYE